MDNEDGAHVYMLRCSDGSYYVGSARRGMERRLSEHNSGTFDGYTSKRLPVVIVWSEHFLNITDAIAVERQVKGWSRAKKEALIRGDFGALRALAKRGGKQRGPLPILRDAPRGGAPQILCGDERSRGRFGVVRTEPTEKS